MDVCVRMQSKLRPVLKSEWALPGSGGLWDSVILELRSNSGCRLGCCTLCQDQAPKGSPSRCALETSGSLLLSLSWVRQLPLPSPAPRPLRNLPLQYWPLHIPQPLILSPGPAACPFLWVEAPPVCHGVLIPQALCPGGRTSMAAGAGRAQLRLVSSSWQVQRRRAWGPAGVALHWLLSSLAAGWSEHLPWAWHSARCQSAQQWQ